MSIECSAWGMAEPTRMSVTDTSIGNASLWVLVVGQVIAVLTGVAAAAYGNSFLTILLVIVAAALTLIAWRRRDKSLGAPSSVPANLLLIALPTALAGSSVSLVLGVAGCAFVGAVAILIWPQHPKITLTWLCAILPAIALMIVLRPNFPGTVYNGLFVIIGCAVVALAVMLSESKTAAMVSLVDGVGVFTVASLLLWLVGFAGKAADRTVGLENSLTGGERVIFPLSTSLAATPAMAAVFIAAVVPIIIVCPRHRLMRLAAVPCAVLILVLSDSRVSMVGAAVLCSSVLLAPRPFRLAAPWIVAAAAATPFVYGYIQAAVTAGSTWAPWLMRTDEQAGTLARRDYIWTQSLDFYGTRVDWFHQAFGFGSFGHVASGASGYYYVHFEGLGSDARLVTPHNTTLQILFDGGWTAAAALAGTMVFLAWKMSRNPSPIYLAGLSMLVALSIVSATEVALSPSHAHAQPTWWVLVILGMIMFSQEKTSEEAERQSSSVAESHSNPLHR